MATGSALARFLTLPENRSALAALTDLRDAMIEPSDVSSPNPLFLHGPTGTGKTRLVHALIQDLDRAGCTVCLLSGNDFAERADFADAEEMDLLIVEDLQHLPTRYMNVLIGLIDAREQSGLPMVFTANAGPGRLEHRGAAFPARLRSRLARGLVVALAPLQAPSRRRVLETLAEEHRLALAPEIIAWLAQHLIGGGRQLDSAIRQLKALQGLQRSRLCVTDIAVHFGAQIDAAAPSVQRIAEQVSGYFRVPPKQLISARRSRDVLLPRQISMYLARQLTNLSLQQIGKYFGGRDHKTVQHACKKVEEAMKADAELSGTVRQLHAQLA